MRNAIDYARDYLDQPAIVKPTGVELAQVVKQAQEEAYAQGLEDGMKKFFDIAVEAGKRARSRPVQPELFTEDPHDNMLMNMGQQASA